MNGKMKRLAASTEEIASSAASTEDVSGSLKGKFETLGQVS